MDLLLWLIATIWVKKDVNRVSAILEQREKELSAKSGLDRSNQI